MCAEEASLALRLRGPMQSWGTGSQYAWRETGLLPSKSAVIGLCCAAMGAARGSTLEKEVLENFEEVSMLTLALEQKHKVSRIQDFHTVLDTVSADGKEKNNAVLTHRQYLQDAYFIVLLNGNRPFFEKLGPALQDPVWGLWLGRKCCIPSTPVYAGLYANKTEAMAVLHINPNQFWAMEQDVSAFEAGTDSYADIPLRFASHDRVFGIRRVKRQFIRQNTENISESE